jgi:hypothetical protein
LRLNEFPVFTIEEANYTLRSIIEITEETIEALEQAKKRWAGLGIPGLQKYYPLEQMTEEDYLRTRWASRVVQLGGIPKGYFVVDFQSPDPETYYCWTYGEEEICHTHKVWESFADRRPLDELNS